ncbi:MAG: hypothetical protein RMN52_13890 [Anaerolineae bacterium]|nr:hypothetical protein [Candidatus Roseilinea sp.]MDW8451085.1 hypothetical protein [Anaerolineae bacterium]
MDHVLSAADERGLKALSLDSRLRRAFFDLPASTIWELAEAVPEHARRRGLVYWRDGKEEVINIFLRPTGVLAEQMNYFHTVSITLQEALKRVPDLYLENAAVREVTPLQPEEEAWLRELWTPAHRNAHCVFGRLDAMVDFTSPTWKDTLAFVEPNLVGVGGISLIPSAEDVAMEVIVPALQRVAPDLHLERHEDLRELFMRELQDHLEQIGRPGGNIVLADAKYSGDGPAEFETLRQYYTERGYNVFYADPAELYLRDDEVWYEDKRVDLLYRDYALADFPYIGEEGGDVEAIRLLFKRNQVVSSMAGDFDHKSTFELLTDSRFSQFFTPGERQLLRRHVLWTRVLTDRKTTDPTGDEVDLPEYTRANRELLVIKPNRSYGGDRVLIGPAASDAEWHDAIDHALTEPGDWVVQRLARITAYEFPVVQPDRTISVQPFYMVVGFAPTKYGTAVLGRASQKQVVNVAQRGGMCAVLVGRHGERLR